MSTMEVESSFKENLENTTDDSVNTEQPTAFILKLFEMINGAPDEVIAWTPEGDAFIIGANLKILESETLPRFFRHNRFQSFVRQLNFYSFRKINRERTMWVYKHDLFHRDRPEDLALLRRRTCPTIDGRRQSLSRPLNMKPTASNPTSRDTLAVSEMIDVSNVSERSGNDKKRKGSSTFPKFSAVVPKRPSLDVHSPIMADSNFSNPVPLTESEDSDDQGGTLSNIENHHKAEEQAMVVLKIASQLAQHARNSKNGSRVSGFVTPTFGASRSGSISSGTLLTYDDEQERMIDTYDVHIKESRVSCSPDHTVPMDQTRQIRSSNDPNLTPLSKSCAEDTIERLIDTLSVESIQKMKTATKLARFCMTTYPNCSETVLCNAIRILLTSCLRLEEDFNSYRSALRPSTISTTKISETEIYYQMWLHEEGRRETIRSFGVFAVNNMKSLLRTLDCRNVHTKDISLLERTISVWQKHSIE